MRWWFGAREEVVAWLQFVVEGREGKALRQQLKQRTPYATNLLVFEEVWWS